MDEFGSWAFRGFLSIRGGLSANEVDGSLKMLGVGEIGPVADPAESN
jgi:hypothetical protein